MVRDPIRRDESLIVRPFALTGEAADPFAGACPAPNPLHTESLTMFDNLEPIATYTADQAIDDGVLVVAAPEQFGPKLLVTRAVFDAVWPAELLDQEIDVVRRMAVPTCRR